MSEHANENEDGACMLRADDARELLEYIERELQAKGYRPGVMLQLAGSMMLTVGCAVVDEQPGDKDAIVQAMRALQSITQSVIRQTMLYWRQAHPSQKHEGN